MYGLLRDGLSGLSLGPASKRRAFWPTVSATVVYLGLTSMFTDISSEMATAILPIYLLFQQQASVIQFGIIDGLYQGGSAIVRLITGVAADRMGRRKELAAGGYALSALARVGMVLLTGAGAMGALILVDRFGKGIRTAPRDAMISLATPTEHLGAAFGVHRTLDTVGALIGPLLAFGLLILVPLGFGVIFMASLCIAVIGLAVIVLLVEDPRGTIAPTTDSTSFREAIDLLRVPSVGGLLLAGAALALFTVSDSFVYVALQRGSGISLSLFPLFYVGTSFFYLALAMPLGRLADLVGRVRMFLCGQLLLLAVYAVLLLSPISGIPFALLILALFGAFYASTDGVLMAAASALLPESLRTSGLSFLGTATAVARLLSSVVFGLLWAWRGPTFALAFFLVALGLTLLTTAVLATRRTEAARA